MGPVGHTIISTAVGVSVWGVTGSPLAGGVSAGVGVLVDVDHLVDLYQSWIKGKTQLVIVPFHGWEYSIAAFLVMCFVYYHPVFFAVIAGHLSHVTTDHFHNRLAPLGYFVVYRICVRFDSRKIAPRRKTTDFHHNLTAFFPFRGLWEPWYFRKIEPWLSARQHATVKNIVSDSEDESC